MPSHVSLGKRVLSALLLTSTLLVAVLSGCTSPDPLPADPYIGSPPKNVPLDGFLAAAEDSPFLAQPSFAPPDWTHSFRLPVSDPPSRLSLPDKP
jgi:hypothetical protein